MLGVTLPDGEYRGSCTINGQKCAFKVEIIDPNKPLAQFWFRPAKGTRNWEKRQILSVVAGPPGMVNLYAADADGTGVFIGLDEASHVKAYGHH